MPRKTHGFRFRFRFRFGSSHAIWYWSPAVGRRYLLTAIHVECRFGLVYQLAVATSIDCLLSVLFFHYCVSVRNVHVHNRILLHITMYRIPVLRDCLTAVSQVSEPESRVISRSCRQCCIRRSRSECVRCPQVGFSEREQYTNQTPRQC